MRKQIFYLILLIVSIIFTMLLSVKFYNTNNNMIKNYIIRNSDNVCQIYDNTFTVIYYDNWYFTDITIKLMDDSSYYVLLWGDRDSKWWWLLNDHIFFVDVSYNKSKKIDVLKDIEILKILHDVNKQETKTIDKHKERVNELVDYYFSILENLIN